MLTDQHATERIRGHMGQSIAILIGNTNYNELLDLACCKNDVLHMRTLLSATQKFSQIVDFIDQPVLTVKDTIRDLADQCEGVEEVFFFFSGHGMSNNDDFYMCFGDFHEHSPNSTGLSRADAFGLMRMFSAEVSIIVIDACEAGRNLIKSDSPTIERAPATPALKTSL